MRAGEPRHSLWGFTHCAGVSRAALAPAERRQLRCKSLVACSEKMPYATGSGSGGKAQPQRPHIPVPARPCPSPLPQQRGAGKLLWDQGQLVHPSPAGAAAALPGKAGVY